MSQDQERWVLSKHDDNEDIVLRDSKDRIVANCSVDFCNTGNPEKDKEEQLYTAKLINAAVNSCFKINPDNPLAAAEAIVDMFNCVFPHGHPSVSKILKGHGYGYEAETIDQAIKKAERKG
jgi:hypothetical protein